MANPKPHSKENKVICDLSEELALECVNTQGMFGPFFLFVYNLRLWFWPSLFPKQRKGVAILSLSFLSLIHVKVFGRSFVRSLNPRLPQLSCQRVITKGFSGWDFDRVAAAGPVT